MKTGGMVETIPPPHENLLPAILARKTIRRSQAKTAPRKAGKAPQQTLQPPFL